mmetsp:Transcript_101142/g.245994  ORF Transcript_101142/g.245994 Transcript_101142/m.245994 type:complete len:281 (+) Transcript_101142:124-966(+)
MDSNATGVEEGGVPGLLRLGCDHKRHDAVPIAGDDITAGLEDAICGALAVPAGSTPSINAPILQLLSCCCFSSCREPRITANRHCEPLWQQHNLDRALPRVAQEGQGDVCTLVFGTNVRDVLNCPALNIHTIHRQDLVTLENPHAASWRILNADLPVELVGVPALDDLTDAHALLLGEHLYFATKRLFNCYVKDGLVATNPLDLPVPLRPGCHVHDRTCSLPALLHPCSPCCSDSQGGRECSCKGHSQKCQGVHGRACCWRLQAFPHGMRGNVATQASCG